MTQSRYWRCMYPKEPEELDLWTDRLHGQETTQTDLGWMKTDQFVLDIIRNYQSKQLYDNYKLTSLYIYRTGISKSFENQVLAR